MPILVLALLLLGFEPALAQDLDDLDNLSLSDLINMPTTVASKTARTARTSPGIVTVITREEIRNMGARDLIDVLHLVPGLDFGHDVQGVVGLAVRGNWAQEGKYSLVIDGQEMNEILYSTAQFGNHYPVDHIQRIEIIRGPGSAIYGGYAELAVINVVTMQGEQIDGLRVEATYGQREENYGRRNVSLQLGEKIGDWNLSFATLFGEGRRGDGSYTGYVSTGGAPAYDYETYDYSDNSANDLNPHWYNFGMSNGKLDIRVIHDNYQTTTRHIYGYSGLDKGVANDFVSTYVGVKYAADLTEKLTLTPYLNYRKQRPYLQTSQEVLCCTDIYDIIAERIKAGLSANYVFADKTELLTGFEFYSDKARAIEWTDGTDDLAFKMSGKDEVSYKANAVYLQSSFSYDFADLTLGVRWEELETPLGSKVSSIVPRAGLTKAEEDWHYKALASQAYRTPAIFNFDLDYSDGSSNIEPETTTTYELEYGHALFKKSYLTANLFHINIQDPIVYQYIDDTEIYMNFPKVSTYGLELDYRWRDSWGYVNYGYSYYQVDENKVPEYDVEGFDQRLVGIPQHKITLNSSIKTGIGNMRVNPSVVHMSRKSTYELNVRDLEEVQRDLPAVTLVNLYINYRDAWFEGFDLGVGVYNIFDVDHRFVQPYNGELGHVPGPKREYLAKAQYHWTF